MLVINKPKIRNVNETELQNILKKRISKKINNALKQYEYFVSEARKLPRSKKIY